MSVLHSVVKVNERAQYMLASCPHSDIQIESKLVLKIESWNGC